MGESLYVGIHARMTLKQHAIIKVVDFCIKKKEKLDSNKAYTRFDTKINNFY